MFSKICRWIISASFIEWSLCFFFVFIYETTFITKLKSHNQQGLL